MAQRYKSVIRSRAVRGRIIEVLIELNSAAPGLTMLLDDLTAQVSAGTPFEMDNQELQAEILYLAEKKLIEIDNGHARITANGIDFRRAGLPWDGVDAYSGRMTP